MPITKSAKKKVRQDKKRHSRNIVVKTELKQAVKQARVKPSAKNLTLAYSALDKASKKNIIHQNQAARLKSRLSQMMAKTS